MAWLLGAEELPESVEADHVAVRWDDASLTYGQLKDRALRLANSLHIEGIRPGDRIATLLFNRGEIFDLYFASAFSGCTLVPINFRFSSDEVEMVLRETEAKWLFTQTDLHKIAKSAASALEIRVTVLDDAASGPDYASLIAGRLLSGQLDAADPHLILYSSGTTGRPKGAMLSHQAIVAYALQQAAVYPAYDDEMTLLITAPLFNTGGINDLTVATFAVGGTVCVLPSRNWSAERMTRYIDSWSITHTIVFPSMMEPIIAAREAGRASDWSSVRLVVTGGETCPVNTVSRFRDCFSHLEVVIGYGSTELGLATLIKGEDISMHPASVGRVAAGAASPRLRAGRSGASERRSGGNMDGGSKCVHGIFRGARVDSCNAARWVGPFRRPGAPRRRGPPLHRRASQGRRHLRGPEHLPG